mmetsp:Transcript_24522/g.40884  ORF Transcript_24522/g.40884 Transcript_24522/m.40884 type:complete len:292 (-) Transcript_24522:28-903(-)
MVESRFIFVLAVLVAVVSAWKPAVLKSRPSVGLSALKASSDLAALQGTLFSTISEQLGLKTTDYAAYQGVDKWTDGDFSGEAEWCDESMGSKLTGVSRYSIVNGATGFAKYSIDGWMGPSLMNPHMLLNFGCDPSMYDGFSLTMDMMPRGPTPIGSDNNYMDNYYSAEAAAMYDRISTTPDVYHMAPPVSLAGRLVRSPLYVSVVGLSLDDVANYATAHVEGWIADSFNAQPVEARQRGAINMRDDKLRQYFYQGSVAEYAQLLGGNSDLVLRLGAGSTGPLAEAYVGGGS